MSNLELVKRLLTDVDVPLHNLIGDHPVGSEIERLADRIHSDLHDLLHLLEG